MEFEEDNIEVNPLKRKASNNKLSLYNLYINQKSETNPRLKYVLYLINNWFNIKAKSRYRSPKSAREVLFVHTRARNRSSVSSV